MTKREDRSLTQGDLKFVWRFLETKALVIATAMIAGGLGYIVGILT